MIDYFQNNIYTMNFAWQLSYAKTNNIKIYGCKSAFSCNNVDKIKQRN